MAIEVRVGLGLEPGSLRGPNLVLDPLAAVVAAAAAPRLSVESRSIGNLGQAGPRPYRSPPLGPERLGGSSRVRRAAREVSGVIAAS